MKKRRSKYFIITLLIILILLVLGTFIKLPYYVTKPGLAQELEPIIDVENGYEVEGKFMLTTIRMGQANIFSYGWAKLNKYYEIYPINQIRKDNESDEEYNNRQLYYMEDSQESAITVAYKYANKPVSTKNHGIYVMQVVKGMPAADDLKPGDRVFQVDGIEIKDQNEFIEYVGNKKENEKITLTFEREGKEQSVTIPIVPFPDIPDKIGIGITLITDKEVISDPKVTIDTEKIGGPSAGLMFTIEIYNQLIKEDLTHGLNIAGTGTINSDGIVGPIGGISQKIVAADNSNVDIFFAPNENGKPNSDYEQALETAKDIKSDMKIIPVDTFEEAIKYLESLSDKK
ncbi:SepM family pheromone-processing serine protease [Fredinandcohnia quinoae]|uniref:endopeptidase La n=1 Tax=Fredinandcohnia quinoae TaxID=2918902 RepID=A0AAW5DTB3_9BACI|nr:SepM family pheromone-processing serine protease [Fredinandcohnia sp. SECRCQ15]MCH1623897.1 PDZ domain-containing protein [Fredinandcohnia sp. SECRCQ15]